MNSAFPTSDRLAQALASLPHGPEFRFLDRLLTLEPGRSATGQYTVRGTEPFLTGHFPGNPLFPGVLLVEAGAQLAGILAQSAAGETPKAQLRLAALRAVKIRGTAAPGQTIDLSARLLGQLGDLVQATANASIDGVIIMEAELTLSGTGSKIISP